MKTSELIGPALDWAVAKCEGDLLPSGGAMIQTWPRYSTDWAQSGPIIEREGIAVYLYGDSQWHAHVGGRESIGPNPLIAAMRCYVASRLGDDIQNSSEPIKGI